VRDKLISARGARRSGGSGKPKGMGRGDVLVGFPGRKYAMTGRGRSQHRATHDIKPQGPRINMSTSLRRPFLNGSRSNQFPARESCGPQNRKGAVIYPFFPNRKTARGKNLKPSETGTERALRESYTGARGWEGKKLEDGRERSTYLVVE